MRWHEEDCLHFMVCRDSTLIQTKSFRELRFCNDPAKDRQEGREDTVLAFTVQSCEWQGIDIRCGMRTYLEQQRPLVLYRIKLLCHPVTWSPNLDCLLDGCSALRLGLCWLLSCLPGCTLCHVLLMPLSLQERFENILVAQAMSQIPHHISYSG